MLFDLGPPFGAHVAQRGGTHNAEADEEDVRLGVGEGSTAVVVLLAERVKNAEDDGSAVAHHSFRVATTTGVEA